ncbi:unnamed protein product [Closterium sp. Yama58-4]|nr:unnamed protein product [Closterium sp. Yama58-4]
MSEADRINPTNTTSPAIASLRSDSNAALMINRKEMSADLPPLDPASIRGASRVAANASATDARENAATGATSPATDAAAAAASTGGAGDATASEGPMEPDSDERVWRKVPLESADADGVDSNGGERVWRKVLYLRQPFDDTHTDPRTFLADMRTNAGVVKPRYWSLVRDSSVLTLQVHSQAVASFSPSPSSSPSPFSSSPSPSPYPSSPPLPTPLPLLSSPHSPSPSPSPSSFYPSITTCSSLISALVSLPTIPFSTPTLTPPVLSFLPFPHTSHMLYAPPSFLPFPHTSHMLYAPPSLPRSSLVPPSFLPRSSLVPPSFLPRSSLVPPSFLPRSSLVPPSFLPRSSLVPPSFLPRSSLVPPSFLPRSSLVPPSFLPRSSHSWVFLFSAWAVLYFFLHPPPSTPLPSSPAAVRCLPAFSSPPSPLYSQMFLVSALVVV